MLTASFYFLLINTQRFSGRRRACLRSACLVDSLDSQRHPAAYPSVSCHFGVNVNPAWRVTVESRSRDALPQTAVDRRASPPLGARDVPPLSVSYDGEGGRGVLFFSGWMMVVVVESESTWTHTLSHAEARALQWTENCIHTPECQTVIWTKHSWPEIFFDPRFEIILFFIYRILVCFIFLCSL